MRPRRLVSWLLALAALSISGCSPEMVESSAWARGVFGTRRIAVSAAAPAMFVQKTAGTFDNQSNLTTSSVTITGVTLGNTLIFNLGATGISITQVAFTTPTDSSSDVWAAASTGASTGATNGDSVQPGIWWLRAAKAGTHTLSQSYGSAVWGNWSIVETTPMSAVDQTVRNSGNTSVTTGNTGTSSATTQASEFAVAALATNTSGAGLANAAFSDPPSGYTSLKVQNDTVNHAGGEQAYKELAATGAQSATWTWTNTGNNAQTSWGAALATFKTVVSPSVVSTQSTKQDWGAGSWSPATLSVVVGNGDMVVATWAGWTTGSVIPQWAGSTSGWTTLVNQETGGGNGPQVYAGSSPHTHAAMIYRAGLSAGTYTFTPPALVNGAGDDGTYYVTVIRGASTTSPIRAGTLNDNRKTGSGGFASGNTIAMAGNCNNGDLLLAMTMEENTAASVGAGITNPPSGWTSEGVNQDATNNVPSQLSSRVANSAGTFSTSWTWTDPNTDQTSAIIVAIHP